jgi:hypothetical protein
LNAGDEVSFKDDDYSIALSFVLPYDREKESALMKSQAQRAHDLESRRIEMRRQEIMNFNASKNAPNKSDAPAYNPPKSQPKKRAPKNDKDNQPGFKWL